MAGALSSPIGICRRAATHSSAFDHERKCNNYIYVFFIHLFVLDMYFSLMPDKLLLCKYVYARYSYVRTSSR